MQCVFKYRWIYVFVQWRSVVSTVVMAAALFPLR